MLWPFPRRETDPGPTQNDLERISRRLSWSTSPEPDDDGSHTTDEDEPYTQDA